MMIDDRTSRTTNRTDGSLPSPVFDANSSASAQPVEPIRGRRVSNWRNRFHSVGSRIGGQSRMLAVVILIGLITGALAGMLLVNIARSGRPAPVSEVPVSEQASEIPVTEAQKLDTFAAALGGSNVQSVAPAASNRRPRSRVRTSRARAYRVAVIR